MYPESTFEFNGYRAGSGCAVNYKGKMWFIGGTNAREQLYTFDKDNCQLVDMGTTSLIKCITRPVHTIGRRNFSGYADHKFSLLDATRKSTGVANGFKIGSNSKIETKINVLNIFQ